MNKVITLFTPRSALSACPGPA